MSTTEDIVLDVLRQEIARELLTEDNPNLAADEIDLLLVDIWGKCDGNPYNDTGLDKINKQQTHDSQNKR